MKQRIGFVVTGRVQGVAFRAAAQRQAERLALAGFVANRPDGTVHGEAEGDAAALATFVAWLHRGPTLAKVAHVATEALPLRAGPPVFVVER